MAKLGLQLYTVRDEARKDYFGTIRKVAEIGYEGIEFPGRTPERSSAKELRKVLDDSNLDLIGIVFDFGELDSDIEKVVEFCKESGCPTAVFPWIPKPHRTIDGYKRLADQFNKWGSRFKQDNIRFLYHVHGYEFEVLGNTNAMEILIDNLDENLVDLEIDVYWVEFGGEDSIEFMKKYGHRSPLIHFKDMKDKVTKKNVEVGSGFIDMVEVASIGNMNNAEWFIVEQEAFDIPAFESIEISLNNLKKIRERAQK